eukprot:EG_transcript_67941
MPSPGPAAAAPPGAGGLFAGHPHPQHAPLAPTSHSLGSSREDDAEWGEFAEASVVAGAPGSSFPPALRAAMGIGGHSQVQPPAGDEDWGEMTSAPPSAAAPS